MTATWYSLLLFPIFSSTGQQAFSQFSDSASHQQKNVIRYNLSGALLFGADKYIVLGYERVLSPRKSVSVNFGTAAMPKLFTITTDSFQTKRSTCEEFRL